MVSPELLRLHSIPVVKVTQYPGEFIINYPGAPSILLVMGTGPLTLHDSVMLLPADGPPR